MIKFFSLCIVLHFSSMQSALLLPALFNKVSREQKATHNLTGSITASDRAKIQKYLDEGHLIDKPLDDQGNTLLHLTVLLAPDSELPTFLIRSGASIDSRNKKGETSLHLACKIGSIEKIAALILQGASKNAVSKKNKTPLFFACSHNHPRAALYVLSFPNIELNVQDSKGNTALHVACSKAYEAIVKTLCYEKRGKKRAGLTCLKNKEGETPLFLACQGGYETIVHVLLDVMNDSINTALTDGTTPLHRAVQKGHNNVVKLLVDEGALLTAQTIRGQTPLDCAVDNSDSKIAALLMIKKSEATHPTKETLFLELHNACNRGKEGVVKRILEATPSLVTFAETDYSCLQCAAKRGNTRIAQILIDFGANINATQEGLPILHWACDTLADGVVALLLKHNVNVFALSSVGKTALEDLLEDFDEYVEKALSDAESKERTLNTYLDLSDEKKFVTLLRLLTTAMSTFPEGLPWLEVAHKRLTAASLKLFKTTRGKLWIDIKLLIGDLDRTMLKIK